MKSKLDRPGYFGLIRTVIIILPICFVAYLALVYLPSRNFEPTLTPYPTQTFTPTDPPTYTPTPIETLIPTFTPIPPITDDIEVIQWMITDICSLSIRIGVQITGAMVTGGSPPYWIEANYAYPINSDDPFPRRRATFFSTSNSFTVVKIIPPLDVSANRWIDVTVKTIITGQANNWSDRLYFPIQNCYEN